MAEDRPETGLIARPMPPQFDIDDALSGLSFVPAPRLVDWMRATFIDEGAPLENEDHFHLRYAQIGALWTNVAYGRNGRRIVGMAEFGTPPGMGKWRMARAEQQITQWFGSIPDFLLTFDADYASSVDHTTLCALIEHELYHCGQERDEFGMPKFKKNSGLPVFCMRGHDVEEFVGVVRRYGADAAGVRAMIEAAAEAPTVAPASIVQVCGTCQK